MKTIAITAATIGALTSVSATAQSLPDNMYVDGYIELSSVHSSGSDETFGMASLNFGLTPMRGNGFGVGFSLGVEAVNFDGAAISEVALYPAVTFALGNTGLLSVGVPRPVLDYGYIPTDTLAHSSFMKVLLENGGIGQSSAAIFYLYGIGSNIDMYGLRYDGEFGNTKIGASYHRLEAGGGSADAFSIAFQHQLGTISSLPDTKLFGGIERVSSNGSNLTNYTLGAELSSDKLRTGLILGKHDLSGLNTANLYVDYNISDRFSVSGSYMRFDGSGGGGNNAYGLGVEYQFLNGGYVNANYTDQDLLGGDGLYEVSLGWRF